MGAEKMKERVEFKVSKVLGNSGVIPVSKASPKVKGCLAYNFRPPLFEHHHSQQHNQSVTRRRKIVEQ